MSKFLKVIMALALCFSLYTMTVKAEDFTVTQDTDLDSNPASTLVTINVESTYSIKIPKQINLIDIGDGDYICEYDIDIVDASIDDSEHIYVIPDSEVVLSTEGKDDVILSVEQKINKFKCSYYNEGIDLPADTVRVYETDTMPESTGTIYVKEGYDLSAGYWVGIISFDIGLKEDN